MVFMVICGSAQTASPTSPSNNTRATGTNSTEIEVVRAVKASYPSAAFAQSVQGQVVVKVVISETGDVEKAEVISGDPVLASVFSAADLRLFLPTIYEVTPWRVLGGHYGFSVTWPITNFRPESPTAQSSPSGWGMSDLYVSPLTIGWTTGRADFITGYAFDAPTGRYEAGAADNFGMGMWSHELQGGTTVYLDSRKIFSVATSAFLEFHSKKKDQDLRVGPILTLEGGAAYNIEKIGGAFGVGYSLQTKVADDTGSDLPLTALRALNLYGRNRVFSIGPDLTTGIFEKGRTMGFVNVRYLWESAARSSFEGSTWFVAFNVARLH